MVCMINFKGATPYIPSIVKGWTIPPQVPGMSPVFHTLNASPLHCTQEHSCPMGMPQKWAIINPSNTRIQLVHLGSIIHYKNQATTFC